MDRRRVLALGTLLLGLVTIAATAGIYAARSGPGFGRGPTGPGTSAGAPDQIGLPPWLVENALLVAFVGMAIGLVVTGLLVVWFRGREGLVDIGRFLARNLAVGLLVLGFFVGVRVLYGFLSEPGQRPPGRPGGPMDGATPAPGGVEGVGSGGGVAPFVIIVVVLVLFGIVAYLAFSRRSMGGPVAPGGSREPGPPIEDAGDGDQRAVTIEDVPQTNAVYRAWREMATQAVGVSDRTVTASEVAATAVRSGFDREAVGRLTALFEEVRYGNRPVTEERERRAEAAIHTLEGTREGSS